MTDQMRWAGWALVFSITAVMFWMGGNPFASGMAAASCMYSIIMAVLEGYK